MNRDSVRSELTCLLVFGLVWGLPIPTERGSDARADEPRPHIVIRGLYGGVPAGLLDGSLTPASSGINAIWVGSDSLNADTIDRLHQLGVKVFAEFNSMHEAGYLKDYPDAAPIGADGRVSLPPDGWQGLCPTHPGYRANRMRAFRQALKRFPIDGIWLDYHHAHASWEQAEPNLPDTCFCRRCLVEFQKATGLALPDLPTPELAERLLGPLRSDWVAWRCGVFTDWVRAYERIRDEVRPDALLGTFHCPWSIDDRDGALRDKLAIDLEAQAEFLDVLSPMPYHARFGHADDPAWISRQTAWLGAFLELNGDAGDRLRVWPIVQLSDWGESVPASQVAEVIDHGTRPPASGVMVFAWGSLANQSDKVERMIETYRSLAPEGP